MFQFKQFSVNDDCSTMKVGTDAVLLGTWIEIQETTENILEIGSGCGVISLILAQRMPDSKILAIDIDKDSAIQTEENFKRSPFLNAFQSKHISIQDFAKSSDKKFNLIVSNPPFFQNSLQSKNQKKSLARHTETLPFEELLNYTYQLLSDSGRFCCILPYNVHKHFLFEAEIRNLFCEKFTSVYTKPDRKPQLALFSFRKRPIITLKTNLFIRGNENNYTSEYLNMTKDFYLFAE